ncbi:arabinose operon transcriptional regulator AraC [soil metagenome]
MNDMDDPALLSRASAPRLSSHLAVVGHSRMSSTYSVTRPGGSTSWLLIWTIAGGGEIRHAESSIATQPGDLVVLGPGVSQRYATSGDDWELRWFHFQPRPTWSSIWAPWGTGPSMFRVHVATPCVATRIEGAFARSTQDLAPPSADERWRPPSDPATAAGVQTIQVSSTTTTDLVLNAIEEVLLIAARHADATPDWTPPDCLTGIDRVLRLIEADPVSHHTVDGLAAVAAMSRSHFAHRFRQDVGRTPMQAVTDLRLDRARQLLRSTDLGVAQVARAVGFDDAMYFSRVFRRHIGTSPSAYATRNRPTP